MILSTTLCPDDFFDKLNNYICQIQTLDNVSVSITRKLSSRTLGLISLSEKLGHKNIEIIKDDITLYYAKKGHSWEILENQLSEQQILAVKNLPQTKEQIFIEFYSRRLTHKLKDVFKLKNYPIEQSISLNHAQVPYNFIISRESIKNKIVFVGNNSEGNIVFKSSLDNNNRVQIIINNLSLEHVNQLYCFNP